MKEWISGLEEEDRHGLEGRSKPPGPMECWRLLQEARGQDERRWSEINSRISQIENAITDIRNDVTRMSNQQADISSRCTLLHVKMNRLISDKPAVENARAMRPISGEDWHEGSRHRPQEGTTQLDDYRCLADCPVRIMKCDRTKGPCLIGKGGSTVRAIRTATGVQKIEWQSERGIVEITGGSQAALDAAETIIRQVMDGDESSLGRSTVDVWIDPALTKRLLDNKGRMIQRWERESLTHGLN